MIGEQQPAILFLTQAYPDTPESYRGIFIRNLAKKATLQGFRPVVVTPRINPNSKKHETHDGIRVIRFYFPSGGKPLIAYRRVPIFRMLIYMASVLLSATATMRRYRCELVHVHWIHPNGIVGVFLRFFFKVPLIIHVRGSDFHTFGTKNVFFTHLTRFVLLHSDQIFCTSKELEEGILMTFPALDARKVSTVYNDIDGALFHPIPEIEARRMLNIRETGIHLLFVGNLVREKGVFDLVEAVIKLHEAGKGEMVLTHVVGTGPLHTTLAEAVRHSGLEKKILLHGPVPPGKVPLWLNAASILILPSKREGMPNVILEALACGVPVLSTNVGDVSRFVREGENGFLLYLNGGNEALYEKLTGLLYPPETLIEMKKRLQKVIASQKEKGPSWGGSGEVLKTYARLLEKKIQP